MEGVPHGISDRPAARAHRDVPGPLRRPLQERHRTPPRAAVRRRAPHERPQQDHDRDGPPHRRGEQPGAPPLPDAGAVGPGRAQPQARGGPPAQPPDAVQVDGLVHPGRHRAAQAILEGRARLRRRLLPVHRQRRKGRRGDRLRLDALRRRAEALSRDERALLAEGRDQGLRGNCGRRARRRGP